MTKLVLFFLFYTLAVFVFGFGAGYLKHKESEALWSEDDIHNMMNNTD